MGLQLSLFASAAPDDFQPLVDSAEFSDCRRYRYSLVRVWSPGDLVVFACLNPSVAGESLNDPSVRRMIGFARSWGFGALEIVNLYPFVSKDPAELRRVSFAERVGPGSGAVNMAAVIRAARRSGLFVCAWGADSVVRADGAAARLVASVQRAGVPLFCLGVTLDGAPKHPLYLPASTVPVPFLFGVG